MTFNSKLASGEQVVLFTEVIMYYHYGKGIQFVLCSEVVLFSRVHYQTVRGSTIDNCIPCLDSFSLGPPKGCSCPVATPPWHCPSVCRKTLGWT